MTKLRVACRTVLGVVLVWMDVDAMIRCCSVPCSIDVSKVDGFFTLSQSGRPRELNHLSMSDPVVDPQSSHAQRLVDQRRLF